MQIQSYTSTLTNKNKFKQYPNRAYSTSLKNKAASFGANPMNVLTDGLAHGMGRLGNTKVMQRLVDYLKDKNYQQHLAAFVGVVLSSFYMIDTAKSKKIESDQKLPLITNQAVVCGLSTAGAYTLDNYLDKHLGEFTEKFNIANITDEKTRKMFAKIKDNPEYTNVIKRKLEETPGTKEAINLFKNSFNVNMEELKALDKSGQSDKSVKKIIELVEKLPEQITDKAGNVISKETKAKEIFLDEIKQSEIVKGIFQKQTAENVKSINIDQIANPDVKRIVSQVKSNPKNIETVMRIQTLKDSLPILDKMFEFNNGIEKKLAQMVEKGQADETVKKVFEEIKSLPKKLTNTEGRIVERADKAKEIFMREMKNSKALEKIFKKQSFANALKLVSNNDTNLSKLMNGFNIAKSLMIFAMIYRFISPVFATPIANCISEKFEFTKKKEA